MQRKGTVVKNGARSGTAEYMREWRKRAAPETLAYHQARGRVAQRALWIVARAHPDEYDAAVAREMRKEGY